MAKQKFVSNTFNPGSSRRSFGSQGTQQPSDGQFYGPQPEHHSLGPTQSWPEDVRFGQPYHHMRQEEPDYKQDSDYRQPMSRQRAGSRTQAPQYEPVEMDYRPQQRSVPVPQTRSAFKLPSGWGIVRIAAIATGILAIILVFMTIVTKVQDGSNTVQAAEMPAPTIVQPQQQVAPTVVQPQPTATVHVPQAQCPPAGTKVTVGEVSHIAPIVYPDGKTYCHVYMASGNGWVEAGQLTVVH